MNKIKLLIVPFIVVCFFCSCRSTKTIQKAIVTKDTAAIVKIDTTAKMRNDSLIFIKDNMSRIEANRINYVSFSAKMDVDYTGSDGKKYDVNAHVRMQKDSILWISITAIFGIEGVRAIITKDSIKILNKQDKLYTARSVSYLQEISDLPLTLSDLQNLIIGNPVFLGPVISSYSKSPGTISLYSKGDFFKTLLTVNDGDRSLQSCKLDDVDEQRNRTCFLKYAEYEDKKIPSFSTKREINISEKGKTAVKLHFKQYDFNETLSFPFSVPKSYEKN
jgi:Domain of unknown function (DUF4292)